MNSSCNEVTTNSSPTSSSPRCLAEKVSPEQPRRPRRRSSSQSRSGTSALERAAAGGIDKPATRCCSGSNESFVSEVTMDEADFLCVNANCHCKRDSLPRRPKRNASLKNNNGMNDESATTLKTHVMSRDASWSSRGSVDHWTVSDISDSDSDDDEDDDSDSELDLDDVLDILQEQAQRQLSAFHRGYHNSHNNRTVGYSTTDDDSDSDSDEESEDSESDDDEEEGPLGEGHLDNVPLPPRRVPTDSSVSHQSTATNKSKSSRSIVSCSTQGTSNRSPGARNRISRFERIRLNDSRNAPLTPPMRKPSNGSGVISLHTAVSAN